ncbi:MAG: IS1595 family transposase [Chitinophagaceae bacterium]
MNFIDFQSKFGSEEDIVQHYINLRYNGAPTCPHCKSIQVYHKKDRRRVFHCASCKNTFSIFTGTIFENTHTDLRKWFYAIHLFLNAKKGISGMQLQREISGSYRTAWRMLRQIRTAMRSEDMSTYFQTVVEIDETYVGGKPRPFKVTLDDNGEIIKNKRGRGTNKTPVIGVIDRDNKKVHAKVAMPNKDGKKLTGKQLLGILNEVAKKGITVMTDEFRGYNILSRSGFIHLKVDHSSKQYSNGDIHTNSIESFWATFKRGIYGTYHSISIKYMQLYVNEFCWRYNNRLQSNMFDLLLSRTILPRTENFPAI